MSLSNTKLLSGFQLNILVLKSPKQLEGHNEYGYDQY